MKELLRKRFIRILAKVLRVELPTEKVYKDPVEDVIRMPDNPSVIYFWKLRSDAHDNHVQDILAELQSRFIKNNGRDPQSLHIVGRDFEDVKNLDPDILKKVIVPWLNNK